MKKRVIPILLCLALLLTQGGCGAAESLLNGLSGSGSGTTGSSWTNSSSTSGSQTAGSSVDTSSSTGTSGAGSSSGSDSSIASSAYSASNPEVVSYNSLTTPSVEERSSVDAESMRQTITNSFTITTETSGGYSSSGSTYTITQEGEYTLSGSLNGNIVVDAEGAKVELILSGCSINSSSDAPITILNAEKVSISAASDSFNEIIDARETRTTDTTDELTTQNAGAAIYSTCDLTLKGHGALVITGNYNNGVASKDDLEIKNLTLKVTAANAAIKGNDSVTIDSAELIAIAKAGDGIKTESSDVSGKENQKGTITISGGTVNIYAACDGLSAAYDVQILGDGYVGIYTDKYSEYSADSIQKGSSTLYMIFTVSDYSAGSDYYVYFNDGETGVFVKAGSPQTVYGGRTAYYALELSVPAGYDHVTFGIYESGVTPGTDNYKMCSENMNINSQQNAFLFSTVSSDALLDGDWASLSNQSSGNSTTEYSTKGIKAANSVLVGDSVTIIIYAVDDGIHVNGGDTLENGNTGEGCFVMNGGTVQITSSDDGVHADSSLYINGGTLIVTTSYEGLEAGTIEINGGRTFVYATDDAVNGSSSTGRTDASVTVNGGYLEVETPSGDTDAIDVNGSFIMNGGFVLVQGGSSSGTVAGSVDVDGSITVNGGCIIACGGVCEGPEGEANAYISSGTSLSAGDYVLADAKGNVVLSFTLEKSFGGLWIACDGLVTNTEYTLTTGGSEILSWTQEEGTMGTGNGFGGFGGGFGGGGFGGGGFGGNGGGGGRR